MAAEQFLSPQSVSEKGLYKMGFDIKRMDIYRKVPKDLTQPTVTGAVISICCVLFIIFMLATELLYFVSPDVKSELLVANNDPTEK